MNRIARVPGRVFHYRTFRGWGLFVLFFLFSFFCPDSLAQRDLPLGKDVAGFEEGLLSYMLSDPNLDKEEKEMLQSWVPAYLGYFSGLDREDKEQIADIARLGHKARLQAYPDLYRFFLAQQKMRQEHGSSHGAWLRALHKVLKRNRPRNFKSLVGRTSDLLEYGCLYKSNAAYWKVSSADFLFLDEDEPAFLFRETDLSCRAYRDSTCIYGSSGTYYPLQDRFEGQGGKVYWTRVGLDPDSCHTGLGSYSVNLRQGRYEARDVVHYNLYLYPMPLSGTFSDKLTAGDRLVESHYPQFVSRGSALFVPDIFEDVDLSGPLVQVGRRTNFGSEGNPARMYVREGDRLRAEVTAARFQVEQGRISSSEARFVMRLDADSMYNPSVSVRYDAPNRILHLTAAQGTGLRVPFIDTYHKLRMDFEAMRWYLGRKEVEIGLLEIPGRLGSVSFKSLNLFSREELGQMMMGTDINPLYLLSTLSKRKKTQVLPLEEVARWIHTSRTQALAMLHDPIAYGYVSYDPVAETVTLLPQLFHNLDVTADKADFDELEFHTVEKGLVKAVMRLDSLDIRMCGVPFILLSSKQNVYAMPSDSVVHIYKDRDFHFDGYFHAGIFNYSVRGARFYYDDFKVDIADVRQLGLEVNRMEDGELRKHAVESVIRSLTGTVFIDRPDNKGGKKDCPEYPIFESTQPAYVYYDEPGIQAGAYAADSFYFQVDPFRMEKLNTVQVDSIRFDGTLFSYGIFPDIREALVVRPDYSLGFGTSSPQGGWPVYDGKALYGGSLSLDKGGLYGAGSFFYLGSRTFSRCMVFLPRRMYAKAEEFHLKDTVFAGRELPSARAEGVNVEFFRSPDVFRLASVKDSLIRFYREDWKLSGSYAFSSRISKARGLLRNDGRFFLNADVFDMAGRRFGADSGDFEIRKGPSSMLRTEGVAFVVDLDARRGSFRASDGTSPVEFGINRYAGYLSDADWDMDAEKVHMRHGNAPSSSFRASSDTLTKGDLFTALLPGEEFRSTRRAQAGLKFQALSSVFSYSDTLLQFEGVKRLLIADALFVPAGENVLISKSGQMVPLQDAELYFGDRNRLHAFHDVQVQVLSAKQYRARGLFDYRAPGMEAQPVLFTGIRPLSDGYSQASTTIRADSGVLALNEAFQFIGKIDLNARQTYPFFSGNVRMNYRCQVQGDLGNGFDERPESREESSGENVRSGPDAYDDFEYEPSPGEEDLSNPPLEEDNREEMYSGYDDFEYVEEDESEEEPLPQASSRRNRKKDPDAPVPALEAARLAPGNPFLEDGIQFQAYINSDSVCIPIDDRTRSTAGRLLGCGFYTQPRSGRIKFLFMERKISTDIPNLAVKGSLQFSPRERSYRVLDSMGTEAFTLRLGSCFAKASGLIDPVMNTYELGIRFFGDMMREGADAGISIRAMGLFDFYLSAEIQKRLAALLNQATQSAGEDAYRQENLLRFLRLNLSEKDLEKTEEELALTGVLNRIPGPLRQSLVFSDLHLVWDPDRKAFFSRGKAELLAVGDNPVNKTLRTMVSLRKTRKGDIVDVYLEANASLWVYFSYTNHYMQIVTSDEAFNDYLGSLKSRVRRKGRYEFYLSTLSKRNTFVGSFLNLQEEYQ